MELVIRFIVGGTLVSLFAVMGDVLKPRTFGGLFGAAPSVALATLVLTILADGKTYAAIEARSMIAGAIGLFVYALVTMQLLARYKFHAFTATILAIPVWAICSLGIWHLLIGC
jgi:hypothetical protein